MKSHSSSLPPVCTYAKTSEPISSTPEKVVPPQTRRCQNKGLVRSFFCKPKNAPGNIRIAWKTCLSGTTQFPATVAQKGQILQRKYPLNAECLHSSATRKTSCPEGRAVNVIWGRSHSNSIEQAVEPKAMLSRRNTINSSPGILCFRDEFRIWPQVILKGSWFPGKLKEQTSDFAVKGASKKTQTHLPPRFCFKKKKKTNPRSYIYS